VIKIEKKEDCCGCTACYNSCPRKAISMKPDQEGFLYPLVNVEKCIDCGLCDSVCPVKNKMEIEQFDRSAYALRANSSQVVSTSTSGGFVSPLAEWVFEHDGVVCGATYDDEFRVIHKISGGGTKEFRGSKYVQSDLNDCFAKIKIYLEQGSLVCFIGTTCQVYGLMTYLKKKYRNLLTIDLVCHGTPSPKLWEKYLSEQKSKYHSEIENVVFRNKTYGYHSGTMRIQFKNGIVYYGSARVDPMLKSFFTEISSRPSCYNCRFKTLERCSDFTIYDCWHVSDLVDNLTDDDKEFTNLIVQSSKGAKLLSEIADRYEIYPTDLMTAIKLDGVMIQHSAKSHPKRGEYYMDLDKESLKMHVQRFIPIRKQDYLIERSKGILYRMGIYKILKKII
jgi:coenzyme F420-reducing hydrogenase beta subunit